jgi:hypothetical protein
MSAKREPDTAAVIWATVVAISRGIIGRVIPVIGIRVSIIGRVPIPSPINHDMMVPRPWKCLRGRGGKGEGGDGHQWQDKFL